MAERWKLGSVFKPLSEQLPERWGALPLGELHPEDRCALCGEVGKEWPCIDVAWNSLHRTVLAYTQAAALVCVDTVACERRRAERKR